MNTETDRIAYNKYLADKQYQEDIKKWLSENPSVGVLNTNKYYVIQNNETVFITPFSKINL